MKRLPQNETRERIMDSAEKLFMARGFNAVKLRDIAEEVGMKHASLYYYVPKGKDQLFAEVVRRSMARHNQQMKLSVKNAGDDFQQQVYAISDWLTSQPPIDLPRMAGVDLPALSPELAKELETLVMVSLNEPIVDMFQQAKQNGVAEIDNTGMASMSLLTVLQSIHHIPPIYVPDGLQAFGRRLVDMLLKGWLAR